MEEAQRKLPFIQKMAYSVGHLLNDLAASMWFSYLLVYFHEVRHIDNITAGYLMLVGQITDALFTPFVGIEVDRTTGLCGMARNKTWHLIGTISFAASYPFLFNACIGCDNNTSDLAQFIYYTPFFVISQIGWACTQIAHLSLIPVLTSDENERVELNGLRYAFTVLSNLLVFGIFWSIFEFGKTSHKDTILLSPADGPKFRVCIPIYLMYWWVFKVTRRSGKKTSKTTLSVIIYTCIIQGTDFYSSSLKDILESLHIPIISFICWEKFRHKTVL